MTIRQLRRLLMLIGDGLAKAAPILIAIADALAGRSGPRKPPR